jgi:hypothetical protein
MSLLPMEASGRRPAFFETPGMDQLLSMILELAAEISVVRERVFILEAVLNQRGLAAADAIESYTPTAEESAALAKLRDDATANIFRTLNREHRPVTSDTV